MLINRLIILFPGTLLLAACVNGQLNQIPGNKVVTAQVASAAAEYRIGAGDELELRFFFTPELNVTVTVRPDGKINLPLVGDVATQDQTPAQLVETLKQAYSEQVKRPEVSVNVHTSAAQRVFVGGEVGHPGAHVLQGPMTVLQAVMMAEGLKDTALSKQVIIVRRGSNNERTVFTVNLDAAVSGDDPLQDIMLQPFDIVVVPRSGIANVNLWVEQYIKRNVPTALNFTYNVNHN